ncbi:GNAT family N-acetyltransferase [Pseudarthrobacter sp. DSP2-3-2b1]|uniref:GNAT family N-acetyltransferase n=1 Tax=Pseudarthrobacter sp. DSP2-3-2b1 TaxID=2804661 RepID=UPI003CFAD98D
MAEIGGVVLSDGVIVLRPLRVEDAVDHLSGEDAELVRWLNGGPGTTESVQRHFEHVEQMWANHGPIFTFAIRLATDESLVGTIDVQLNQATYRSDQANLAYGLYPQWRGRGFATRAVNLALAFLGPFATVRSALIRVKPGNVSSAAVAIRAGFTLTTPAAETGDDGHDWYDRALT